MNLAAHGASRTLQMALRVVFAYSHESQDFKLLDSSTSMPSMAPSFNNCLAASGEMRPILQCNSSTVTISLVLATMAFGSLGWSTHSLDQVTEPEPDLD